MKKVQVKIAGYWRDVEYWFSGETNLDRLIEGVGLKSECDHGDHIVCNECMEPEKPRCDQEDDQGGFEFCPNCPYHTKPAGDVAQVHLDTFNDEYELTDEQLHADDYVDKNYELPKELFCKCEHGTPCFDTCFEFKKYVEEKVREKVDKLYSDLWSQAEKEGKHEVSTWLTKQFSKKGNHD